MFIPFLVHNLIYYYCIKKNSTKSYIPFIMKIPNKRDLTNIAFNQLSDNEFEDFK